MAPSMGVPVNVPSMPAVAMMPAPKVSLKT